VRIATSIVTWRLPIIVGVAALAIGCRQEAPLAPAMAAKVAEIAEVKGLPRRRHHRRRDRVCGDHVDPGERETDLPRRDLDDRGAGAGGRGPVR